MRRFLKSENGTLVMIIAGIIIVAFVFTLWGKHEDNSRYVEEYCSYGAVSKRQLETCKDHVTAEKIRSLKTPAARFAGRVDGECLEDSGPFCERIENQRLEKLQQDLDAR